jgi:hypothetical protein
VVGLILLVLRMLQTNDRSLCTRNSFQSLEHALITFNNACITVLANMYSDRAIRKVV